MSKDILIVKFIIESKGLSSWRVCRIEVKEIEAEKVKVKHLHVHVLVHEKVKKLDIRWYVNKDQREHEDDLNWLDDPP